MQRRETRERGRVDTVDLVLGIVLVVGLPVGGYGVMRALDVDHRSVLEAIPSSSEIAANLPPGQAELDSRMAYIRKLYQETARELVARAGQVPGSVQGDALQWAYRVLVKVRSEVAEAEGALERAGATAAIQKMRAELGTIRSQVDADEAHLRALDVTHSALPPPAGR